MSDIIQFHQFLRGGTQDGRVSPIRLKDGEYASGKTWMLVALNSRMSEVLQTNTAGAANLWPKLHTHSLCPGRLATISLAIFTGPAAPLI